MRRLDFRDHRRELDDNRYVYAVVSRRSRGLSIGVNLNPDKACNFACAYCQVDRTRPGGPREVDPARLASELDHLLALVAGGELWSVPPFDTAPPALRRVNDIAFAGDGEPTACPVFAEAVGVVGRLRAARGLDAVRVILLTNATLFHRPAVWAGLEALAALDGEIWAKLDAGTQAWFEVVDGTRLSLDRVVDNITRAARRWPLTLQCMFPTWEGAPPPPAEIDAWLGRVRAILDAGGRLREVQVCSVARRPADPRIGVLPEEGLREIADRVRRLGVPATVVPGIPGAAG